MQLNDPKIRAVLLQLALVLKGPPFDLTAISEATRIPLPDLYQVLAEMQRLGFIEAKVLRDFTRGGDHVRNVVVRQLLPAGRAFVDAVRPSRAY